MRGGRAPVKKLLAGNISGERIREQRLRLRLSQSTLAARVQTEGVILEQGMISRIESGDRIVTDYELRALAKVLGVPVDYLIENTDRREK
ncbi:MAG: XRE family transcriptional regulator [Bacillota bacterium]|nr:MAG: XRE family transcriptional regulator [Bacillota bacterium]